MIKKIIQYNLATRSKFREQNNNNQKYECFFLYTDDCLNQKALIKKQLLQK